MQCSGTNWLRILFDVISSIQRWSEQRRVRAQHRRWLMEMDDRMLKDIGLYRADISRLYQRKKSAPTHEKIDHLSARDNVVRSRMNGNNSGNLSPCSGGTHRTL